MQWFGGVLLVVVGLVAGGCAAERERVVSPEPVLRPYIEPHLEALSPEACRSLLHDDATPSSLRQAMARSIEYLEKIPAERGLAALDRRLTAGELRDLLLQLQTLPEEGAWESAVCDRAAVYRTLTTDGLLVTGYYQPELRASRTRKGAYRYPLYRQPDDLVDVDLSPWCPTCSPRVVQGRIKNGRLVPYLSRAEIDAGALAGKDYEIAWLQDPVEVFFMHIQGSAVLRFDDGVQMHVSYSNSNGRPYTSIGRVLIERGKLTRDQVSLQTLRDYLRARPDEQGEIMATNERYIFFRAVPKGPIGSLGVALTSGRSIAADATVYPPGALAFLRVEARPGAAQPVSAARFAMIQDAGTAITGPGRIDVYWGTGETAEEIAGDMRNPGELFLILPR